MRGQRGTGAGTCCVCAVHAVHTSPWQHSLCFLRSVCHLLGMICHGDFLFPSFLICALCVSCACMGMSFLSFGKFSSMISSKVWSVFDFSLIYAHIFLCVPFLCFTFF